MGVLDHYEMPPNCLGHLEWVSGVLRVRGSFSQISEFALSLNVGDDMPLDMPECQRLLTMTHELYHFWQFANCGYLYLLACNAFNDLAKITNSLKPIQSPEDLFSSKINSYKLRKHFRSIDVPNNKGITVRSLMESSAFLVEYRSAMTMGPKIFHDLVVPSAPGNVYRDAYLFAAEELGIERAYYNFLPIAFVSLLYTNPAKIFPIAVMFAKTRKMDIRNELEWRELHKVMRPLKGVCEQMNEARFVGIGLEVFEKNPKNLHPIYTPTLLSMADTLSTEEFFSMMFFPESTTVEPPWSAYQPILFDHGEIYIPPTLRNRKYFYASRGAQNVNSQKSIEASITAQVMLGAVVHHAFKNSGFERGTLSVYRYVEADILGGLKNSAETLSKRSKLEVLGQITRQGAFLQKRGDLSAAEPFFRHALDMAEQVLGERDPDLLHRLSHLGELHRSQGAFDKAEPFMRRALEIQQRIWGDDDLGVAKKQIHLGNVLCARGDIKGCLILLDHALSILIHHYGVEHEQVKTLQLDIFVLRLRRIFKWLGKMILGTFILAAICLTYYFLIS